MKFDPFFMEVIIFEQKYPNLCNVIVLSAQIVIAVKLQCGSLNFYWSPKMLIFVGAKILCKIVILEGN